VAQQTNGGVSAVADIRDVATTDGPIERPVDASVWELAMFDHLTSHVELERDILREYIDAADGTTSKALRYLVDLIVADERRHHRMFIELARSLAGPGGPGGSEPLVPHLDLHRVDRAGTLEIVGRLLQREMEDKRELKALQRQFKEFQDTTLWGLIIDLMRRDTDKHIAILRFAKKHIGQARK
jgi:rubrerythrin